MGFVCVGRAVMEGGERGGGRFCDVLFVGVVSRADSGGSRGDQL